MENILKNILNKFNIKGNILSYKMLTNGNINSTIKITVNKNGDLKDYVLQKINTNVFKNPTLVMQNISNVTKHLQSKYLLDPDKDRKVLNFYPTNKNTYYFKSDINEYFRLCDFVPNSTTFNVTNDKKILEETGKAFGEFQLLLSDFPIDDLHITIKNFHNTVNRFELFRKAIKEDPKNRVCQVQKEIESYFELEEIATKMHIMSTKNQLPLRVTHNDTKCNNVMFDKQTLSRLCVIDLDTIMPGLIGFDFGDAIRFCANSVCEDEKDTTKVFLDLDKFEAFSKGFVTLVKPSLTPNEIETLPLGAITMTLENGLRFLTDYINGDTYFKIDYPLHNLDRTRCQLVLAKDMIKNLENMKNIIKKYI
ncbi:MAG: phosphotransferase [Clostridia bacterium]|nr:phosphotransferase [Clostridia bacterium]